MNLAEAPHAFEKSYYRWAQAEAALESRTGFPLLAHSNALNVAAFLEILRALDESQRTRILSLYQKKAFYKVALPLSQEEQQEFVRFRSLFIRAKERVEKCRAGTRKTINTRTLREILIAELSKNLGPVQQIGPGEWECLTSIGTWICITNIEIERNILRYSQSVSTGRKNEKRHRFAVGCDLERIQTDISVARWLGIASDTEWDLVNANNPERVVQNLIACCAHFLKALPTLAST